MSEMKRGNPGGKAAAKKGAALSKKSAAKLKKVPAKAKKGAKQAHLAAGAGKALQIEERLRLALAPLTQAERLAFRDQFSDAQCDTFGAKTKANAVLREGRVWAATIDSALGKHPQALRRYGKARFAWFLDCLHHLSEALEVQRAAHGSAGASKRQAELAKEAGRARREELMEALEMLAGGNAKEREALARATGTAENAAELARSLKDLAELAEGWLGRATAEAKALVASVDLTAGDMDAAREAAEAVDRAAGDATLITSASRSSARDLPAVNRAEGRLLLEMRTAMRVFERAHARSAVVPRLVPGPATRSVLARRGGRAGKDAVDVDQAPAPASEP